MVDQKRGILMLDREPMMLSRDRRIAFTHRRFAKTEAVRSLWDEELKYAQEAARHDAIALIEAVEEELP